MSNFSVFDLILAESRSTLLNWMKVKKAGLEAPGSICVSMGRICLLKLTCAPDFQGTGARDTHCIIGLHTAYAWSITLKNGAQSVMWHRHRYQHLFIDVVNCTDDVTLLDTVPLST